MNINKVIANGQTIVDLTDTTATADDVKMGKLFHDISGALTNGTFDASGLEYEEGTYTPNTNIAEPSIYFANNHTEAPAIIIFQDATGEALYTKDANASMVYVDLLKLFGCGWVESTKTYYTIITTRYRTSSWTSTTYYLMYGSDNPTASNNSYSRYTATETYFKPHTMSASRNWLSTRTYKWIAIWK